MAGFRTLPAMLVIVPAAFAFTFPAYFRAKLAGAQCMVASQRHKLRSGIAKCSAFHIQLYTLLHPVLFL
jgi:hypothetical protein